MKKFLLFAAAALAFASCEKPDNDPEKDPGKDPVEESISIDPKEKAFDNKGGSVDVKVTSTGDWTLTSEKEYDWVSASAKSGKDGATVKFSVEGNTTVDEQNAVFTFKTGKATATFKITVAAGDAPEPAVEFELADAGQKNLSFEAAGGNAMVNFKTSLNKDAITLKKSAGADWVTAQLAQVETPVLGIVIPANTGAERTATLTLSAEGANDIVINIAQKAGSTGGGDNPGDALITTAGKFNTTRAYPKWDGNATPFENMEQFTVEALIYHQDGWSTLNTVLGIDGYFMIRAGDEGIGNNELQVCVCGDTDPGEVKMNSGVQLDENKWYHLAVSYDRGIIKLYIDGEEKSSLDASASTTKRTFNREHTDEEGGWGATRCFWVGYACGASRCWKGMMSEVRIWSKALTTSELTAKDHFYKVDPASSGLIAYWKFNEGEGNVVKDHTSNGNNLYCQINVKNNPPTTSTAEDGMEWATVSLPE